MLRLLTLLSSVQRLHWLQMAARVDSQKAQEEAQRKLDELIERCANNTVISIVDDHAYTTRYSRADLIGSSIPNDTQMTSTNTAMLSYQRACIECFQRNTLIPTNLARCEFSKSRNGEALESHKVSVGNTMKFTVCYPLELCRNFCEILSFYQLPSRMYCSSADRKTLRHGWSNQ